MLIMTSRQDLTATVAPTVSVHKTPNKFAIFLLEMATGIWPYQYKPVVDINFGIDWESVMRKCHENSGGYVCVYCIL